jgi:cell division protein ZapA (FtsZ GTPase activity inhibitor)
VKLLISNDLHGLDEQIEDIKQFTRERIRDKVTKKERARQSLKQSLAVYSEEKIMLEN